MPLEKQSLNNFLPEGFETLNQEGYKENFTENKIKVGYEKDIPDIVSGPNLNNLIDVVGKNTNTLNSYVEYLNGMPINNVPTTDENGQLNYINLDDKLTKNQITNCLLEVPQNIKCEVTDSGFTLKAGSVVTFPNGANNFEYYTVPSDITLATYGGASTDFFIMLDANKSNLRAYVVHQATSGTTAPTGEGLWYDTTNNLVKFYNSSNELLWTGLSFPFVICSRSSGTITSIKQIFNGFGYIGSTIWADKGIKGLIPNGRNEDGTLKNTEFTTDKVMTSSYTATLENRHLVLSSTFFGGYINNIYKEEQNINVAGDGTIQQVANVGSMTVKNGAISFFQTKQPVKLLTYDDIRINNPYFFGQYIWSEFAPDNLSWLKSSGQWNSGTGYQGMYDWALEKANAGTSGFALSTASYTDYDFVVNTSAKTFRLPIKVQNAPMGGTAPVVGTGKSLGLMGDKEGGLIASSGGQLYARVEPLNQTVGTTVTGATSIAGGNNDVIGVTTNPDNSGVIADLSKATNSNLSLYFYVGETAKDTGLINASQIASTYAEKLDKPTTYVNGSSWCRVWQDGFKEQGGTTGSVGVINEYTVSLLQSFSNTNYYVNFISVGTNRGTASDNNYIRSRSLDKFVLSKYDGMTQPVIWYACGY